MSSKIVRDAFRAQLASGFPTVPTYDTLGVRLDNNTLPVLWMTTEFVPVEDNAISIGSPACRRETGTFRVYVVGVTGGGDGAVITQADAVVAEFRDWSDVGTDYRIEVVSNTPPSTAEQSDGRWLIVAVDINFRNTYYA